MEWDFEVLKDALNASLVINGKDYIDTQHFLRFSSSNFDYSLRIAPDCNSVLFSFDSVGVSRATPLLEFSFYCTLIDCYSKIVGGTVNGICFFECVGSNRNIGASDLRLRLLPVENGGWYAWCNSKQSA